MRSLPVRRSSHQWDPRSSLTPSFESLPPMMVDQLRLLSIMSTLRQSSPDLLSILSSMPLPNILPCMVSASNPWLSRSASPRAAVTRTWCKSNLFWARAHVHQQTDYCKPRFDPQTQPLVHLSATALLWERATLLQISGIFSGLDYWGWLGDSFLQILYTRVCLHHV